MPSLFAGKQRLNETTNFRKIDYKFSTLNPLPSALDYLPKITDLPLVLAGPILRRTEPDKVTVWLALKEARSLSLKIYMTKDQGATIEKLLLQGSNQTVQLGKNLHLVAITAGSTDDILLQPGEIYAYNIYNNCSKNEELNDSHSLINDLEIGDCNLSYFSHQLPTFSLPPQDLNQLKIVHGSCRKPHGGGIDSLSFLDNLIQESATIATARPHQLFLTGDQIYGDDVADPILWLAHGVNELLFGWSEELPLKAGTISANDLMPGQRTEIARVEGGLTAMVKNSPEEAKSHLFSFGEYAAVYLLAWCPVFMPSRFPKGKTLFKNQQQARHWEQEISDTNSFIKDLKSIRRALANIPVYTICDDHDVSDDWYLNREWCDRVLGKPLGKRVVQNGILAYALFQAWGNTPEKFEPGTGGAKLLEFASRWLASAGKDSTAKTECDRYLGIPAPDIATGLPKLNRDQDVLILSRNSQAIPWNYTVSSSNHEVIVLDTRTWRGYPEGEDQGLAPPMLLSPQAFEQQLAIPLSQSKPEIEATFVVLPTNLVALDIIDWIQQFDLSRDRVFNNDVGDSWNFHIGAFVQLLLNLCRQRDRVIILSGDIHYSCAVRLTHWFHDSAAGTVLAQLTSSAMKNSELPSRIVHTKLKSLLPEKTQRWLVWEKLLKIQRITKSPWKRNKQHLNLNQPIPDCQYRIEWIRRQAAQSVPWQRILSRKRNQDNLWQKLKTRLISWLWRNPWLQEGPEVVGRNNLSLVKFKWSKDSKTVIQETYWHPPWNQTSTVKSCYEVSLEPDALPPFPKAK
ncbi:hypothetical protein Xen7305DRAFT_00018840 [Xenococcus sp. PCC 7305]|uniref:hypothetical protein n=1 Tax=Xenococcus sp. PCC 7305 TaxID=102125 RepID=UPI0002AC91AF|nr:hypothetical protein [Xenococcus sp. PCC 7305]ELS02172.1 hypothetical protein Xen7305DRAFT_00018840 [Xenococcus sp. PCC 7305]